MNPSSTQSHIRLSNPPGGFKTSSEYIERSARADVQTHRSREERGPQRPTDRPQPSSFWAPAAPPTAGGAPPQSL